MTYPGIENDKALLAVNPDLLAVEERRAEREAEYDQYVALDAIPWGTVLAFAKGDRVPASTVERLKWDELGLVAKRTTKEGRAVLEETDSATTEEKEKWAADDKAAAKKAADAEKAASEEAPKRAASAKAGSN